MLKGSAMASKPARRAAGRRPSVAVHQIPVSWDGLDGVPVSAVNAFLLQFSASQKGTEGEYLLNIGFIPPPLVSGGSIEERIAEVRRVAKVSVQPVARIALSRERVEELRAAINQVLDAVDVAIAKQK